MAAREIVRDANVLGGRWHFAGTTVAVAEVRAMLKAVGGGHQRDIRKTYARAGLTAADLEAAARFPFPASRSTRTELHYSSLVVACECGEDTPAAAAGTDPVTVVCVCGRRWKVTVGIEPDGW